MARLGRSGDSADPGHAGAGGVRRGGHTQVASAGRTVFLFGFVCLILGVMVARLLILMAEAHSAFDRAWLPTIAAGCAVAVGWAGLYAAAIWRYPGQRWVQWIGYAYAFATVALMAPFFPRIPGVRFSFTSRLHRGSSLPLLDSLTLGAMAFVATGLTIAALAVLLNRPLSLLAARQLATGGGADASSMLHVRARLREVGPAGAGPWRQGELRVAPGSVTWSMSRGGAPVDLTGATLLTAASQPRTRGGRTQAVLVLAAAGQFEVRVRSELFQEFVTLADHFRPWPDQGAETVDRGPG